jgi:hypothetical protein
VRLYLPSIGFQYDAHAARVQQDALVRAMIPAVSQDEAVPFILLQAPDGGVWRVTISDTGTLTTAKVLG